MKSVTVAFLKHQLLVFVQSIAQQMISPTEDFWIHVLDPSWPVEANDLEVFLYISIEFHACDPSISTKNALWPSKSQAAAPTGDGLKYASIWASEI